MPNIHALYESVTQRIIAELEQGALPWFKCWKSGAPTWPINWATKNRYSGVNVIILWDEHQRHGYARNEWGTFLQFKEKGGQVRKGEKATQIVFTKQYGVKDGDDEERQVRVLRTFYVFNVAQVDGLPAPSNPVPVETPAQGMEKAQALVAAIGADIRHGGAKAAYLPTHDFITMPVRQDFNSDEYYWCTLLHELCHWSGNEKRLNRNLNNRFGDRSYAAEELTAEIGAAFLCAHVGIEGDMRHSGYIESWLSLLKDDPRAVFTAAAQAQKAADYLIALSDNRLSMKNKEVDNQKQGEAA